MVSQPRHGTPEEGKARILRAARERYLGGKRIELTQLAAAEGIGRATAYRWLGDNDRLVAEILAERVRKNFVRLVRENNGLTGREKVLAVVAGFLRRAVESEHFEALLRRDERRVLKIVMTSAHGVQEMTKTLLEELLNEEHAAGHIDLPVAADILASGIVRLIEAHIYADVVAGEKRDVEMALQVIGLLMAAQPEESHTLRPFE